MITEWADVLRADPAFPYKVVEHNDWKHARPQGDIPDLQYLVWHHDGSAVGPSPGDVDWLITEYNAGRPSAQIIIGYDGTWHFAGSGYASHAGVTDGIVTNANSAGTETDQTTGEKPSPALIDSVQRGYAAIFRHEGWPATRMRFHKMIARPVGRKPDPDFGTTGSSYDPAVWTREYAEQVSIIQNYIDRKEEDMPLTDADVDKIAARVWSQIIKEAGNLPVWALLQEAATPPTIPTVDAIADRVWSQIIKEAGDVPVWALLNRAANPTT